MTMQNAGMKLEARNIVDAGTKEVARIKVIPGKPTTVWCPYCDFSFHYPAMRVCPKCAATFGPEGQAPPVPVQQVLANQEPNVAEPQTIEGPATGTTAVDTPPPAETAADETEQPVAISTDDSGSQGTESKFTCEVEGCGRSFDSLQGLRGHQNAHRDKD